MKARILADAVGTIGSALCAVQCLAGPLLLVTGSAFPAVLLPDETFHVAMLWIVLPAGMLAFSLGCRQHKDFLTLAFGITGMAGLILATTVFHEVLGETGEKVVTFLAAGSLVAGHIRNFRLCRAVDCTHNPENSR